MRHDLLLDENSLAVVLGEQSIRLLPMEFDLLAFLYAHPHRTFTRDELLEAVWTMEAPVDRTVDDHVYRLRKKLSSIHAPVKLETVRGKGYRFMLTKAPIVRTERSVQPVVSNPLLRDPEYRHYIKDLFRTYVVHGQGQGIRTLMDNPSVFGVQEDARLHLSARFMTGDYKYVLEDESQPLSEWLFWILGLYEGVQFDYASSLSFVIRAIESQILRTEHHLECNTFHLHRLYFRTGQVDCAIRAISDSVAWCNAMPEFHDGYIPLIRIDDALFSLYVGNEMVAQAKLELARKTLEQFPWQRELAFFRIVEGFFALTAGDSHTAETAMDEGLQRLDEIGIANHQMNRLHEILFFLREVQPHPTLLSKYEKIWNALSEKYGFSQLSVSLQETLTHILG